ncbi:hypothetical protein DET50_10173 [Marinobacter pelagius]|uniref:Uncharacterized protein n=1 Tax=Marinobacter pelagius TaxID=379482 RepID=A0A366H032_9GAMM|nr:hypothetical protein DET50_10173 [Marinobacter pelagius]
MPNNLHIAPAGAVTKMTDTAAATLRPDTRRVLRGTFAIPVTGR